ncbi:Tn7-like element transposition protein TnsE [Paenibacillus naphthalenovorans]|uniref:Tn7-like element transposition protein TnsE n=1 Tax=Paenibacillus naphthalenovorans TaxID=162209 RepID=UPI000891BA1D|nr:Tn7-like element transposition protein TnsE [Paenibacillus naphthalenovorans]SDJ52914.1 hypothetical protein SAMN05421868_13056 [Paenibacillus naphthalenovorans]
MTRISPWRFNEKKVRLIWYGDVFQEKQTWKIGVWFDVDGVPVMEKYPVGLLPQLRIAQWFHDGKPLSTQKDGTINSVQIADLSQGHTVDSLAPCRRVGYYLYAKQMMMNNKMWAIPEGNITYFIPYVELLRVLFATAKEISNAIFRPNGLAYLVDQTSKVGNELRIMFSANVAKNSLEDDFIRQIAWIVSDQSVQTSFESVFSYIYAQNSRNFGTALEFQIPPLCNLTIHYRGISKANEVIVFEILGIDGLDDGLIRIDIKHPLLKEKRYVNGIKKGVYSKKEPDEYQIQTDTPEVPKVDTNQPVVKADPTRLGFINNVVIRKHKIPSQVIKRGTDIAVIGGRGGALVEAGVNESYPGGTLQPVDIQSLEVDSTKQNGLEEFLAMIRYLEAHFKDLKIDVSIVDLPSNRRFAYLDNGQRRKCAVVRITKNNRITYVIEPARPDDHSVTTLLLYPENRDIKEHDEKIQQVLRKLVNNQGHWPQTIGFVRSKKLRHTVKLHFEWAQKIYNHIG